MKIGIIGAGNIGGTLAGLLVRAGHEIMFSVRRPDAISGLMASLGPRATIGNTGEAARFGPVLLFAAPYGVWPNFASECRQILTSKIVIDAANPYAGRDGAIVRQVEEMGHGAGAFTASLLPGAAVIKAFNTIFWKDLRDEAHRPPPRLAIPLVGDDESALSCVETLVDSVGFDAVRIARLTDSGRVDPGAPIYAKSLSADALQSSLGDN